MYWLSLYLMAIASAGTVCRILTLMRAGLFAWGVMLAVAGFIWYAWQSKYGVIPAQTEEKLLKVLLIPAVVLSCLVIIWR